MARILLFEACLALILIGGNAVAQPQMPTSTIKAVELNPSILSFGFDAATSDLEEADVKDDLRVIEGEYLSDSLTLTDLQPKQKLTLNLEWTYFDEGSVLPGVTREKFVVVSQFDVTDTGEGSKVVTKKIQVDNIGGGEVTYTFVTPETDEDKYTFYLLRQGVYNQIKAASSGQKPTVNFIKSYLAENSAKVSESDYRVAYLTLKAAAPAAELKVDQATSTCEVVKSLAQRQVDFGGKSRKATVAYIVKNCPEVTIFQKKYTTKDSAPVWKKKTSKKNSSIISTTQSVNKDIKKIVYCAAPKGTSLGSDGAECLAGSLRTIWVPRYNVPETKILTVEVHYDEPVEIEESYNLQMYFNSSENENYWGCARSNKFGDEEQSSVVITTYDCRVIKGKSMSPSFVPDVYMLRKSSCRGSLSNDGQKCLLTVSSNKTFKLYLTPDSQLVTYVRRLFGHIVGNFLPSQSAISAKLALVQECNTDNLRVLAKSFYQFDESGSVISPVFDTPEHFVGSLYRGVLSRQAVDDQVNLYAGKIRRGEQTYMGMLEYFVTDTEYHEFIDLSNRICSPPD